MAAIGAMTRKAPSDEVIAPVAMEMPAANSRVSPGRKNPTSRPHSANRTTASTSSGAEPDSRVSGLMRVGADRAGEDEGAWHRAEFTGATSGRPCPSLAAVSAALPAAGCAILAALSPTTGVRDADRHARDLRRHARPRPRTGLRLPGDQLHVVGDDQRRAARVRRRRQRRHHPVLHRRRGVRLRHAREGHGHRRRGAGRVRARRRRRSTRSTSRCTPTTARRTSWTTTSGRSSRSRRSASTGARIRCSSRTCGTARPSSSRRTCRSPTSCWPRPSAAKIVLELEIGVVGGEEDGVVGEMNEKLYTTPGDALRTAEVLGTGEKGRYLLAATFGNVHGVYKPGNVKLRPEILKELQDAVGEKVGRDEAVRPGLPRRLGFGARGDPRGARLRRGEDERRHRHAVRLHPRDRRAHVHQLRRRAQGRRRGRQQEGLRPAQLHEAGRGRHGRARAARLRGPAVGRHRPSPAEPWRRPRRQAVLGPAHRFTPPSMACSSMRASSSSLNSSRSTAATLSSSCAHARRPDQRRGHPLVAQRPRDRQLGQRLPALAGDVVQRPHAGQVLRR